MKVYVASSWRNERQPEVVARLRLAGHEVYDFREPQGNGARGFSWSEVDPDWQGWTPAEYRQGLAHPLAVRGFDSDLGAMKWADACVMVQPSGRSAALELGWSAGAGKRTLVLLAEGQEPELMMSLADHICLDLDEVVALLEEA